MMRIHLTVWLLQHTRVTFWQTRTRWQTELRWLLKRTVYSIHILWRVQDSHDSAIKCLQWNGTTTCNQHHRRYTWSSGTRCCGTLLAYQYFYCLLFIVISLFVLHVLFALLLCGQRRQNVIAHVRVRLHVFIAPGQKRTIQLHYFLYKFTHLWINCSILSNNAAIRIRK